MLSDPVCTDPQGCPGLPSWLVARLPAASACLGHAPDTGLNLPCCVLENDTPEGIRLLPLEEIYIDIHRERHKGSNTNSCHGREKLDGISFPSLSLIKSVSKSQRQ